VIRSRSAAEREGAQDALATVATELGSLYHYNFSVTTNMIEADARRQVGPTQLIFSLVGARRLRLRADRDALLHARADDGNGPYLTQADVDTADKLTGVAEAQPRVRETVEIRFTQAGGREQIVYRHILANLEDNHLKKAPAALKHLEAKGHVAGMTKAASYLLTFTEFSTMRHYIGRPRRLDGVGLDRACRRRSDQGGLRVRDLGHLRAVEHEGGRVGQRRPWRALYAAQPKRDLGSGSAIPTASGAAT